METIYIGMDLHKSTSTFCVTDVSGVVLANKTVKTKPEEIQKFIGALGKGHVIELVMEPLSHWYFYADFISSLGVKVHLAHPLRVKAIASAKIKTDKRDAEMLAHLLRTGLLPEAYFAPKEVRNWKELVRARLAQVDMIVQTKNSIQAILFRNGLEFPGRDVFTQVGRCWLQQLELNPFFRLNLDTKLRNLDHHVSEKVGLEKKMKEVISTNNDMKLLMTIPGIEKLTAITIMAEIGDIKRFETPKKLHSYAGLVPTIRNSGTSVHYGPINKQGSKYLRTAIITAARAQTLLRKSVGLRWYKERMRLNNKDGNTATVATARKLLTIVFKVLSEQRPFEERLPKTYPIISST
jgi:transposase